MNLPKHEFPETTGFFCPALDTPAAPLELAAPMVDIARTLPRGVNLMVTATPLALPVADLSADALAGFLQRERLLAASGIVELMRRLSPEIKKRDYLLDELADEIGRLPAYTSSASEALQQFATLTGRGLPVQGLPADADAARGALLEISRQEGIALEYLLGNLQKAATLIRRLGIRDETLNASALFHNFMSGFLPLDLAHSEPCASPQMIERATRLASHGVALTLFRRGDFKQPLADLTPAALDELVGEVAHAYGVSDDAFRRFLDALIGAEENRLATAPELPLIALLQAFRFPEGERELVSHPATAKHDDPTHWQDSALGRALTALKPSLNWLAVSTGLKAAGEAESLLKNRKLKTDAADIRRLAERYHVSLWTGRDGNRREVRASDVSADDLAFDLYCLAVIEKRPYATVVDAARGVLDLIHSLENPEPVVNLNELVSARLAGDAWADIMANLGLSLRNVSLVEAQAKLKALADKVALTVTPDGQQPIRLDRASLDEFRRAIIKSGRALRTANGVARALALIVDKIVPEIRRLPSAVIASGEHDLGRIIELAAAGVPARYPLRRPWTRINLDPLTQMGSGLAPGIRNCLGCPVNSLYGLVTKTAQVTGFEEILTYEATGCFEVYSGIWPYTGKKHPTLHGVFGGAPSELLGGLTARKARLRHALKIDGAAGQAQRAAMKRTLHLGWGGDGATFDIGFGNLSGLFSRLQKLSQDPLDKELDQRALYVCYDNEGYQNTGNQYSAASAPGGHTTTNPQGTAKTMGNDLKKKRMVEIMAEHGASISARLNIHRPEHITRVVARALEDGVDGAFLHFLQPCTTGWKFTADSLTYDLAYLSEEGGLFPPVTVEHGVAYLEIYPTPRNPGDAFLKLQARFKHLLGGGAEEKRNAQRVIAYYAEEWQRNLQLTGYDGEIPYADRLGYLEDEHRKPRINV